MQKAMNVQQVAAFHNQNSQTLSWEVAVRQTPLVWGYGHPLVGKGTKDTYLVTTPLALYFSRIQCSVLSVSSNT